MRRVLLGLLRCPRCRHGGLTPDVEGPELVFGPLRCLECQVSYPVSEGVVDLAVDRRPLSAAQRGWEHPLIARSYERYLRPALQLAVSRQRADLAGELSRYRQLLGVPTGAILDLGCGTGLIARKLAADPALPPVVGMDLASAMLAEAVAQAREAGVAVDFLRAEAPGLPFKDHCLGAVLQLGSLHQIGEASGLFLEIARVLRPGGRYIASSYLPPRPLTAGLHRRAGLFPRSGATLREEMTAAGLIAFEQVQLPASVLVKAEKA